MCYYRSKKVQEKLQWEDNFVFREFFVKTKKGTWRRYLTFSSKEELVSFLERECPLDVFYSVAQYAKPEKAENPFFFDFLLDFDCENDEQACLDEVKRVVKFLIDNLGVKKEHILVYHTGSRGYHIRFYDSELSSFEEQQKLRLTLWSLFTREPSFGTRGFETPKVRFLDRQALLDVRKGFRLLWSLNSKTRKPVRPVSLEKLLTS